MHLGKTDFWKFVVLLQTRMICLNIFLKHSLEFWRDFVKRLKKEHFWMICHRILWNNNNKRNYWWSLFVPNSLSDKQCNNQQHREQKTKRTHVFVYILKLKIAHFNHEIKIEAVFGISCLHFVFHNTPKIWKPIMSHAFEVHANICNPKQCGTKLYSFNLTAWLDWCQCNLFRRVVSGNVKLANTDTIWYWTIIVQIPSNCMWFYSVFTKLNTLFSFSVSLFVCVCMQPPFGIIIE